MDEFDRLLYEGASQLPPDLLDAAPPKPWKKPLDRVCWGLALTTITLNFLYLDYILPAIGAVLMWLSLRSLRRENRWFAFAFTCITIHAALFMALRILQATPLEYWIHQQLIYTDPHVAHIGQQVTEYDIAKAAVICLFRWLTIFALWRGLKAVFAKAEQEPRTAAGGGVVFLYALMFPLAVIGVDGLLGWIFIIIWVLLIRNLFKVSRSLDEAGYALSPAPVKLSNGHAAALWLGVPLLAIIVATFLSAHLPIRGQTVENTPTAQTELRTQLLGLGFSKHILDDLTDDEVAMFDGAFAVYTHTPRANDPGQWGLTPSLTMIEVPVAPYRNVYLICYRWDSSPNAPYTDGLEIIPGHSWSDLHSYPVLPDSDTAAPMGKLLWEENGATYTAPLDIRPPQNISYSSFFGQTSYTAYYADFSLPAHSDNTRAYAFWSLENRSPDSGPLFFNYAANYIHRRWLWQYPYQTPSGWASSGRANSSGFTWLQEWGEGLLADEDFYKQARYD